MTKPKRKPVEAQRVAEILNELTRCRHASQCSGCMERVRELLQNGFDLPNPAEKELRALRRVAKVAKVVVDEWGFGEGGLDSRMWPTEAAMIRALDALKKAKKGTR